MPRLSIFLLCLLITRLTPAPGQPPQAAGEDVPVAAKKTTPVVTRSPDRPATYPGRQLLVGSGGGFTGFSTTYCLLDNGQLFGRRSLDTAYRYLGKQTAANTKWAFATVETTGRIKKVRFDNPGNTYKFVRWKKGKQQYSVTWGAPGTTVPAAYPKFYSSFIKKFPAVSRLK